MLITYMTIIIMNVYFSTYKVSIRLKQAGLRDMIMKQPVEWKFNLLLKHLIKSNMLKHKKEESPRKSSKS